MVPKNTKNEIEVTAFFTSLSFLPLRGRKPLRDLKFSTHHGRIVVVDGQIHTFKDNESIGLLNIIKEMQQLGPMAAGFDRSKDALMSWGCFTGANCGVFYQDVVFARDLFELIEESRILLSALHRWLSFFQPLLAFGPELALSHVNGLLCTRGCADSQFPSPVADASQDQSPNEKIDQHKQNACDRERHDLLAPTHSKISRSQFLDHFGFPSRRNWA